jgi:GTP cyclohydrolase III
LLAQLKVDVAKLDKGGIEVRIELLGSIDRALGAYTPAAPKPKDVEAMKKIIAVMRKQVPHAVKKANERAEKLEAEAAKKLEAETRERQEQVRKRKERLAQEQEAVGELNAQIAKVESCEHTDELEDLQAVRDEAQETIAEVKDIAALKTSVLVNSTIKHLEAKLGPLGRLIANLESEGE